MTCEVLARHTYQAQLLLCVADRLLKVWAGGGDDDFDCCTDELLPGYYQRCCENAVNRKEGERRIKKVVDVLRTSMSGEHAIA